MIQEGGKVFLEHFSKTGNEIITDKITGLIQKECEDMSYKKSRKQSSDSIYYTILLYQHIQNAKYRLMYKNCL